MQCLVEFDFRVIIDMWIEADIKLCFLITLKGYAISLFYLHNHKVKSDSVDLQVTSETNHLVLI